MVKMRKSAMKTNVMMPIITVSNRIILTAPRTLLTPMENIERIERAQ